MKKLLLLPLLAFLTACNPSALIEKFADAEKVKIARAYIQRLMDGDVAALASELEPKLRSGKEVEQLNAMRALFPPGTPTVTNLIGYQVSHFNAESNYNVTYQFGYGSKWIVANAAWREKPNEPRQIIGMRTIPLDKSLQETNAFSFKRAGALHYLFLGAAILVPVFIIYTLVVCIRTKLPRRKWLWIIFVLIGFVQFSLNWTTGETGVKTLYFQLFGAGAMATSMYSPWIISVSLPLGAIAFWFQRRQLLPRAVSPAATP